MALLEAQNASIDFWAGPPWARRAVHALQNVDLSVEAGEVIGVVGESGSGKSTLGNLFIGRLKPTLGTLTYHGKPLASIPRRERAGRFAAVLQHPKWSLNPMMKVGDSVIEPLQLLGKAGSSREQQQRVGEILERVSLPGNYQYRYPHELSGGQRQRVSIARAMITKPEFVLFDEAVSALDVSVQAQVLNMIKDLQRDVGFSAIFISHDLAATRYVASRIAVFYAGKMVEDAPSGHFYETASQPYSKGLQFASGLLDNPDFELKLGENTKVITGCSLNDRCPLAYDLCKRESPPLRHFDQGLRVACHLNEE
ncbi:MAG: ATP-binding cassette domain-containing protein [Gammaproteobacteria bacterium]|nr:ATP-binding cassette domain-containing protein [Gammaproteobacteria bacterium]NKB63173.1 ATP-binding cassette domain-containing protein [Gammaproteobacteria bacterium]